MRRRTALFIVTIPFLLVLGWAAAGTALAGGGCHGEDEATTTEGSSSVVRLQGCTFGPTITRVPVGTEVRWVNVAGQTHDVVGRRFEWGSEALDNGQSFTHRFATAGIYPYSCSFHPGMAGIVVVGGPASADAALRRDWNRVSRRPTVVGSSVDFSVARRTTFRVVAALVTARKLKWDF